jgi:hypothetical protein
MATSDRRARARVEFDDLAWNEGRRRRERRRT